MNQLTSTNRRYFKNDKDSEQRDKPFQATSGFAGLANLND
jgi:hypothetical protein